jgi:hypothetical protein
MTWCIDKNRQPPALGKLAPTLMRALRRMTKPPDV